MAVALFRDLLAEAVCVRLMAFAARFMMDHASGIMYAFSPGRHDISRGTAPTEDPARLESRDQVLSSSGLVGMEDWKYRKGRPQVTMHMYSLTQGLHTLLFHVSMFRESG